MKIYAVGLGPGGEEGLTGGARRALRESDVVVGYDLYLRLIADLVAGKELVASGMRREEARCRAAVEAALGGKTVSLVSSGDAGIYGMAGLLFEVAAGHPEIEIEVVPGVTAASSAAALLGAPLANDFAAISLSDILTPWQAIESRLRLAAQADFCICLYNPASARRAGHLARACGILMEHRAGSTLCGYARNIGREGETWKVLSLAELAEAKVDMFTTAIVGNSTTRSIGGRLVTARGYGAGKAVRGTEA